MLELDPYSAPPDHLRAAHPDRIWFFDQPNLPSDDSHWAFSNDGGTVPGYWYAFNGTTAFPPDGSRAKWSEVTGIEPNSTKASAIKQRSLPDYIDGFTGVNCAPGDFRARVWDPKEYVCYGIWEDGGPVFSAYASDQTTQTNFYTDTGCNDYYATARNWFGCTLPYVAPVNSIWSTP